MYIYMYVYIYIYIIYIYIHEKGPPFPGDRSPVPVKKIPRMRLDWTQSEGNRFEPRNHVLLKMGLPR